MILTVLALVAAITVTPLVVGAILGAPLPAVVAFITRSSAPEWVKITTNLVAALAVAIVTVSLVGDGAVISWQTVLTGILAFLSSDVTYSTVGRRIDINEKPWVLPHRGLGG